MVLVNLVFTRQATVVETGGCSVKVENPEDWDEIQAKIDAQDFHEFLITSREYDEEDWDFEELPDEAA
jgi:hypothetical protein